MYHAEKIIDGVLCYKTLPDAKFKPFTAEQLTERLMVAEKVINKYRNEKATRNVALNTSQC